MRHMLQERLHQARALHLAWRLQSPYFVAVHVTESPAIALENSDCHEPENTLFQLFFALPACETADDIYVTLLIWQDRSGVEFERNELSGEDHGMNASVERTIHH
jgi:hypothetical protein